VFFFGISIKLLLVAYRKPQKNTLFCSGLSSSIGAKKTILACNLNLFFISNALLKSAFFCKFHTFKKSKVQYLKKSYTFVTNKCNQ